ncbi:hypothetical protein LINPERHAP1_LOCUS25598 [Linum perenne]
MQQELVVQTMQLQDMEIMDFIDSSVGVFHQTCLLRGRTQFLCVKQERQTMPMQE